MGKEGFLSSALLPETPRWDGSPLGGEGGKATKMLGFGLGFRSVGGFRA